MTILAIESSSATAGTALVRDRKIIAEYSLDNKMTHSQTLLPMIDHIMKMAECRPEELDAIAVSSGPGSYTGLRIGAATAKGLGLSLKIPVIPVPTLMSLSYSSWAPGFLVSPLLDARRGHVYTALYRQTDTIPETVKEPCCVPFTEWADLLHGMKEPVILTGDVLGLYRAFIREHADLIPAPAHQMAPRAAAAAVLGDMFFEKGIYVPAGEFVPDYMKLSQAERVREEKLSRQVTDAEAVRDRAVKLQQETQAKLQEFEPEVYRLRHQNEVDQRRISQLEESVTQSRDEAQRLAALVSELQDQLQSAKTSFQARTVSESDIEVLEPEIVEAEPEPRASGGGDASGGGFGFRNGAGVSMAALEQQLQWELSQLGKNSRVSGDGQQ